MAKYYDIWEKYEDVKADYKELPPEEQLVYAGYSYEDYSGGALVVYHENGTLFEVNDGHCSCNGLECWEPEETTREALRLRGKGWDGLQEALDVYENETKGISADVGSAK